MEFQKPLFLFSLLLTLLSSSQAHKFNVGGSKGWVPNPSESYNNWAGRNRFQINDTIVFKYNKGSDSVLEVKKEDYDKCNKTNPIKKFENGDTEFKFDRSGPFYFISGKDGNCEKGQKLLVVVLTPRTPPTPKIPPSPKTSPSPSPKANPPTVSPPLPSPSSNPPTVSPPSPSPSPSSNPPTVSPPSPSLSPSPSVQPPSTSPSPASSPVPAGGPTAESPAGGPTAMSPGNSPPAPSPDTGTSPPAPGPSSSSPPPAGTTSPPSLAPSSNSTAPTPNSGFSVAPSSVLVYCVTIVAGAALLRY